MNEKANSSAKRQDTLYMLVTVCDGTQLRMCCVVVAMLLKSNAIRNSRGRMKANKEQLSGRRDPQPDSSGVTVHQD